MNAGSQLIAMVQMDCNSAILQTTSNFKSAGFQVLKSFDLCSTTSVSTVCINHQATTCQMVVLIVYSLEDLPATLVFESSGSETYVSLVIAQQHSTHLAWIQKILPLIPASQFDISMISSLVE